MKPLTVQLIIATGMFGNVIRWTLSFADNLQERDKKTGRVGIAQVQALVILNRNLPTYSAGPVMLRGPTHGLLGRVPSRTVNWLTRRFEQPMPPILSTPTPCYATPSPLRLPVEISRVDGDKKRSASRRAFACGTLCGERPSVAAGASALAWGLGRSPARASLGRQPTALQSTSYEMA